MNGLDRRHHHYAYYDEGGSGCSTRNREEYGAEEQGQREADHYRECGKASPSAFSYAGCTLDIGGGSRSSEAGTGNGCDRVGQEHLLDTGNLVTPFLYNPCALMYADDGSHSIEHVDKEERKHYDEHIQAQYVAPFELAEDGGYGVGQRYNLCRECSDGSSGCRVFYEETNCGSNKDAPEYASAYFRHYKTGGNEQANHSQKCFSGSNGTEPHERGIVVHYNSGILHADEGNEQAYTGTDSLLEGPGDGVDEPVAYFGDCKQDEDESFEEYSREGELPAVPHTEANGKYKESVQAHAGSEGERFLRIKGHHQRTCYRRECGGGEYRTAGHVESAEDAGVDGQNIGHRQESGNAGENLGTDIMLLGIEPKSFSQNICHDSDRIRMSSGYRRRG